jgi:colanic acid biosynthesis glycosyl transferase WcaI
MKILVHTIFYRPDVVGVAKYTAELCQWLAARGHEVTVVAPPPYYPQWRVAAAYQQWSYTRETLGGVEVQRCPIWLPQKPGGLGRILCALSFALTSLPVMLREAWRAPDLVLVIVPSFMNSIAAWLTARIAGAMAWLHIQDFELDLAYELGQVRRGRKIVARIESWILARFDVISSITPGMVEKCRAKGVDCERLHVLPNWFDPAVIYPLSCPNPMRAALGISEDTVVALFAGSMGAKQGVEIILQAARILEDQPNLLFVISGEGVSGDALRRQGSGLRNVKFVPLQPSERLNELLNLADIQLLPQKPSASGLVMPSKLIGMLASGRPVVVGANTNTEIAELLAGCGDIVEPGNPITFASAISGLARDPARRTHLGARARARALQLFRQEEILRDFESKIYSSVTRRVQANGLIAE